jgi:hypothetical protein
MKRARWLWFGGRAPGQGCRTFITGVPAESALLIAALLV